MQFGREVTGRKSKTSVGTCHERKGARRNRPVGRLRYSEHRSVPEIRAHLIGRGRTTPERTVADLLDESLVTSYRRPPAGGGADHSGEVILDLDGLQSDVGHEVLRVIRDALGGEILLARILPCARDR